VPGVDHVVVWLARAAWLLVAVIGGAAVGEALAGHARAVEVAGTAAAWTGWAVGALALAVPGVATLTLARAAVPASLIVSAATVVDGVEAGTAIALLAPALAASALVATAEFGRVYIQASAYGAESRFGLRPPIGYLVACIATWLPTMTALVLAVPMLAGNAWVLGALCVAVAVAGIALLPRRWHQLSRRWLVVVPAGVVVHDPVVLADTLMLPRRTITRVGLDGLRGGSSGAADLTGPTPGVAVEIVLGEPNRAVLAPTTSQHKGTPIEFNSIIVSPTRPGAAVSALGAARYTVR
jgi:hypothetical protein